MRSPAAGASERFRNAGLPVSTLYKERTCLWVSAAIRVGLKRTGNSRDRRVMKVGTFMISVSSHSIHWLFRDAAHDRSCCCLQPQTHWWNSIICVWRPACISTFLPSYMEAPCSLIPTYDKCSLTFYILSSMKLKIEWFQDSFISFIYSQKQKKRKICQVELINIHQILS